MKVGDLVRCKLAGRIGMLIQHHYPFDWLVLWCDDASFDGADTDYLEVVKCS